jgi:arylsulfatase A-like enzyme
MIDQVDLAASLAALAGQKPDPATMPDSLDVLPALLGRSKTGRDHVVEFANRIALRQGHWKFIPPGPVQDHLGPWKQVTFAAPGALFDLSADLSETNNVAAAHPEIVKELSAKLAQIQHSGRTPPLAEPSAEP